MAEKPEYEALPVVRHITEELRQPLSSVQQIAFYLEMVLPRGDSKARRQLRKLQREVQHAQWLLADTVHFLDAAPARLELLDLSEAISKSISGWEPDGTAWVCLRLEAELPPVRLDLERLQHLLRNLIGFFSRMSPPGRSIVLRTYATEAEVVLEAMPTMPRFSTADLAPLFEPFEGGLPRGAGLGLASVRKIAEAHGARLEVSAAPPDRLLLVVAFPRA